MAEIMRALHPATPHDHELNVKWAFRFLYAFPALVVIGLGLGRLTHQKRVLGIVLVLGLLCGTAFFALRLAGIRALGGKWTRSSKLALAGIACTILIALLGALLTVPERGPEGAAGSAARLALGLAFLIFMLVVLASLLGRNESRERT
jgi:hypothetical protein